MLHNVSKHSKGLVPFLCIFFYYGKYGAAQSRKFTFIIG